MAAGKGERVPSSHLGGMRSSWLKIHIRAGDWKKYLREKGSKAWAAGNVLCQLSEGSQSPASAFCPSYSAAPTCQSPCELWYGSDHCLVTDRVLVLHLLWSFLQTSVLRLLSC